jgi:hypothetical protein
MKKLENLISLEDFKLKKIQEKVEEIIPEGVPEAKFGMSPEQKISEINRILDQDLDEGIIEEIVNSLRSALLEMEQQGFVDEDTTDKLDDEFGDDWVEWIKNVIELPDFPEEGLNNILEIVAYEGEDEGEYSKNQLAPGPDVHSSIRFVDLDDDEIEIVENDETMSSWLDEGRISLIDNELWVNEDDQEVMNYIANETGIQPPDFEDLDDDVECPDCEGTGQTDDGEDCERCGGTGRVYRPEDIPPDN